MGVTKMSPHPLPTDEESYESTDWLSSDLSSSFCHDPELSSDTDECHVLVDNLDEVHDISEAELLSDDNDPFLLACLRKCLAK